MKKIGIIVALFSLLAMASFAQEELQPSIGIYTNANYWSFHLTTPTDVVDSSTSFIGIGIFVDLIYADISLGFETETSDFTRKQSGTYNATTIYLNSNTGFLSLRGVLKYPFQLGSHFILFPMAGVEYSVPVTDDYWSQWTPTNKADNTKLYLILGLGGDISIGDTVYLRITGDFDLNLTPKPTNPVVGYNYSGYKVNLGLALGFKL